MTKRIPPQCQNCPRVDRLEARIAACEGLSRKVLESNARIERLLALILEQTTPSARAVPPIDL